MGKMAAILAGNNVEEEYLWSCTLSGSNKEYSWEPSTLEPEAKEEDQEKEGPKVKPGHRLLIKSAILMPSAKENEVTVVQIESEGYRVKSVTVPICAMKGGVDLQKYVDLLVPGPSKMKIIHGEGPIHLIGSHCVDYMGLQEEESEDEDEDEGDDENEMETEETAGILQKPRTSPETKRLLLLRTRRKRRRGSHLQRRQTRQLLPPRTTPRKGKQVVIPKVPKRKQRTESSSLTNVTSSFLLCFMYFSFRNKNPQKKKKKKKKKKS